MLTVLDTAVSIMCFCILIISLLIINNQNRKIENLESILYYYRWHGAFDYPRSTGWYLVQTDDNKKKIKVLFYDVEKNSWDYFEKSKIISWCHLPNYLYPQKEKAC